MSLILPGSTIGILGGGQLGKMMALSAKAMGYKVIVVENDPYCPASGVCDQLIVSAYDDAATLRFLSTSCDVITYEFENVRSESLQGLTGYLPQGLHVLSIAQDRFKEKETLRRLGYPVVPYRVINNPETLDKREHSVVIKTLTGGYDGKGQWLIHTTDALPNLPYPVIEEAFMEIDIELSVIVNRSTNKDVEAFLPIENEHHFQKLYISRVPSLVSESIQIEAVSMAKSLMVALNAYGTLTVEMFVLKSGKLVINELAPRPHNSGHLTIEAMTHSQFDQHIKAICGLALAKPKLHHPAAMFNLYGQHVENALANMPKDKDAYVHFYGKKENRVDRKMGHITRLYPTVFARDRAIALLRKSLYKEINHE